MKPKKFGAKKVEDGKLIESLFPVIELEGTGQYFDWKCDFCGEWTDDGMSSQITVPDMEGEDGQAEVEGRRFGYDICKTCLDAGADGVVKRTIEHAEQLERYALHLREGMTLIAKGVKEWRTGEDYEAVSDAFEKSLQDGSAQEEYEKAIGLNDGDEEFEFMKD